MDFQQFQKIFPSPQKIQQQFWQQQNAFSPMNIWPSQFHHQPQQQNQSMNSMFNKNRFPSMNYGRQNFNNMGGHRQHQNFQQRRNNSFQFPPPPPTFGFPSMPLPSTFGQTSMISNIPPLSNSSDGSAKSETPREIFFKTLSQSLKDANKFYCGKQTTWKNPFLYKTYLCENYGNRSYCRFGVNCWYAHGPHELRCIPESDDLPDQAFITQYLSFLGLPKNVLDQLIQNAYIIAKQYSERQKQQFESPQKSSEFPSFIESKFARSISLPNSPIKNYIPSDPINSKKDAFYSSYMANGHGWPEIQSAIIGVSGKNEEANENDEPEKPFDKSFHLFGDSFNFQKPM